MSSVALRAAAPADTAAMLALLQTVAAEGDALPFLEGLDGDFIASQWLRAAGCVVACRGAVLLGMYRYGTIMPGRGSHICTATFAVSPDARGQGIGRALVTHCLDAAKAAGYQAMQFNQVVSTNHAALALYRSLGFIEAGCIPAAFRHDQLGYVDAYVMYRRL
ncbi:ribosomal protein S18 acetylase RimI-like enzyme [Pseudoduganella flava]|nr:N-acetyltransferase [Pseudoduganella flava]TWI45001.1 ribosomal protein S18 acetylase RimI-like enzyme [Pseudoduganella flava]